MGSPSQCRCPRPVIVAGVVHRVHSCPLCVGVALSWFCDQYDLFLTEERESVSVSALLGTELPRAELNEEPVDDGLPF